MNDGGDCRTAPATPGLFNSIRFHFIATLRQTKHGSFDGILEQHQIIRLITE